MTTHIFVYCFVEQSIVIKVQLFIWDLCNANDIPSGTIKGTLTTTNQMKKNKATESNEINVCGKCLNQKVHSVVDRGAMD